MAIIHIETLSFQYKESKTKLVSQLDAAIEKNTWTTVVGAVGVGKTTLLRLLKRNRQPKGDLSGRITADEDLVIAYLPENPDGQFVTEDVWSELVFPLENLGLSASEIDWRVGEMVHFMGISSWLSRSLSSLSAGQKQLVQLMACLITRPDVLILDNPLTYLDDITRRRYLDLLSEIQAVTSLTIIMSTHDISQVMAKSDAFIWLKENEKSVYLNRQEFIKSVYHSSSDIAFQLPISLIMARRLRYEEIGKLSLKETRHWLERDSVVVEGCSHPYQQDFETGHPVLIQLKDAIFRYERTGEMILNQAELTIETGERLMLLGANGVGKTTLLKLLARQLPLYQGSLSSPAFKKREWRHFVKWLPQHALYILTETNADAEYRQYLNSLGVSAEMISAKIQEVVTKLKLNTMMSRPYYQLSAGQQQLIALGKLMLSQPKLLLLDEPTQHLDEHEKYRLGQILRQLSSEGVTIVIATHDREFAALYGSNCCMMFHGKLTQKENPVTFFSKHYFYRTPIASLLRDYADEVVVPEQLAAQGQNL